jgi:hypothetical protein
MSADLVELATDRRLKARIIFAMARHFDWEAETILEMGLGTGAEAYLTQKLNLERRTRDKYRESLDNHLIPAFGRVQLANLSSDMIQEWVSG